MKLRALLTVNSAVFKAESCMKQAVARTAPGSCFQRRSAGRAQAGRSGTCVGLRRHPGRNPGRAAEPKDRTPTQTVQTNQRLAQARTSRYGALSVPGLQSVRPRSQDFKVHCTRTVHQIPVHNSLAILAFSDFFCVSKMFMLHCLPWS